MNVSGLRIVIADDEPVMRVFLADILAAMSHTVVGTAKNGIELLEVCESTHPDLVITDVRMPKKDGIDAAEEFFMKKPVAVIVTSGYDDPDFVEETKRRPIMGYLVKPIDEEQLHRALPEAMGRFSVFKRILREAGNDIHVTLEQRREIEEIKKALMAQRILSAEEAMSMILNAADANEASVYTAAKRLRFDKS